MSLCCFCVCVCVSVCVDLRVCLSVCLSVCLNLSNLNYGSFWLSLALSGLECVLKVSGHCHECVMNVSLVCHELWSQGRVMEES